MQRKVKFTKLFSLILFSEHFLKRKISLPAVLTSNDKKEEKNVSASISGGINGCVPGHMYIFCQASCKPAGIGWWNKQPPCTHWFPSVHDQPCCVLFYLVFTKSCNTLPAVNSWTVSVAWMSRVKMSITATP